MGILISRFRKKPSTKELLEKIETELEDIEDFKFYTQQQQKRLIGSLIIYSIITYIIAAIVFYFYYFPSELSKQILYSLPLIAFPVIIWIIKQLLHWYYRYKLSQNEDQIVILHRERKKLLKEVKEKETYKVAKEILEKYDPEQIKKKTDIFSARQSSSPNILANFPEMELRKRAAAVAAVKALPKVPLRPLGSQLPPPSIRPLPVPIKPGYNAPPSTVPRPASIRPSGIRMPCPILPQQRGVFDKMIEYVVGDGPNNRYALICRQCQSHNGMALREEYEYTAFRCCYCYSYNPSRKQRPMAPRLSLPLGIVPELKAKDEARSTDDSEGEDGSKSVEKIEELAEGSSENLPTSDGPARSTAEDLASSVSEPSKDKDDVHNNIPPSDDMDTTFAGPADGSVSDVQEMSENEYSAIWKSQNETEAIQLTDSSNADDSSKLDGTVDSQSLLQSEEETSHALGGDADNPAIDELSTGSLPTTMTSQSTTTLLPDEEITN